MAEEFEKFLDTLKESEGEPSKKETKPSKKETEPSKQETKKKKTSYPVWLEWTM
jgi:hypothetical protein